MSDIFRVNNTDTRTTPCAFIVNFGHISHFIIIIAEFAQINAVGA